MVNHLDSDAACLRLWERPRCIAVQGRPCFCVDFGLERRLQCFVGVIRSQEVGVANEEALFVLVRVDEPACDTIGTIRPDLAGLRVEYVHAVHPDLHLTVICIYDINVRFPKDHEQVALARVL